MQGSRDLSNLNTLLFHEDRKQLRYYHSALRFCSLRNIYATDVMPEALRQIILGGYDLVFVAFPEKSSQAAALLEEISSTDAIRGIPVVAIMAEEDVGRAMSVMARGVSEILVEPISRKTLEGLADRIMKNRSDAAPHSEKLESARAFLERGQLDRASALFHELLDKDSLSVDACIGLFQVSCAREQWLDAENHILKALEIAKEARDKIDVHRRLAVIFYHYGSFYEKRQYPEKAIKSYRTAMSLDPFSLENAKALLHLLLKRHEINDVVEVIRKTLAVLPPNSQPVEDLALCVRDLARKLVDLRLNVSARRLYEQLLAINHGHIETHIEVADFFLSLGEVSIVLQTLLDVGERVREPRLFRKIGSLLLDHERRYTGRGKFDTTGGADLSFFRTLDSAKVLSMAEQAFHEALLLDPTDPETILGIVRWHLRRREDVSATERLNELMGMRNVHADFWVETIRQLFEERAYEHVLPWLKESLVRFPHDARFCRLNAEYCTRRGKESDAVGWLKKGHALEPEDSALVLALAELCRSLGLHADAVLYYQRVAELSPGNAVARDGLRDSNAKMQRPGKR